MRPAHGDPAAGAQDLAPGDAAAAAAAAGPAASGEGLAAAGAEGGELLAVPAGPAVVLAPGGAPAAARRRGDPRINADRDADHEAPFGCTLRRYLGGDSRAPYWKGSLPEGKVSDLGRKTMSAGWGFYTGRSQAEAKAEVRAWLQEFV